jgi:hypothetical protein
MVGHRTRHSPAKEDFTVKLSRLLATVALIAGGLALPAPASADPMPARPPSPDALRSICAHFAGTYVQDRLSYACQISDGLIVCAERCELRLRPLLSTPPLLEPCVTAQGSFLQPVPGQFACQLREGEFSATCPVLLGLMAYCDLLLITPSEQPMS